jgi:hypothetical protein
MRLFHFALAFYLPYTLSAAQIPFHAFAAESLEPQPSWDDLGVPPNANATGQLIFDTVNSLLQHWSNTRYRNGMYHVATLSHASIYRVAGHNIIPGTVPVGTLLYHGRNQSSVPTIPEWTATDPEHAYHFCGGPRDNGTATGCWQLTFVATRPLKVLYFDGSSGANMRQKGGGTLDAQDLLVWGNVDPSRWLDERARITDLCAWGREFSIDGYVRCVFRSLAPFSSLSAVYGPEWRWICESS